MRKQKQKQKLKARKFKITKRLLKFEYDGMNAEAAVEKAICDEFTYGLKAVGEYVSLVKYFKAKHLHLELREICGALKEGVFNGKEEERPTNTNVEQR